MYIFYPVSEKHSENENKPSPMLLLIMLMFYNCCDLTSVRKETKCATQGICCWLHVVIHVPLVAANVGVCNNCKQQNQVTCLLLSIYHCFILPMFSTMRQYMINGLLIFPYFQSVLLGWV